MATTPKPETSPSDIFMSIKPEHITNIATRVKNHEYRKYRLPASVRRIWFYTTAPVSALQYVARISGVARILGQVPEDGGLGNEDFNAGRKVSGFGYEILGLWELDPVIGLLRAKEMGFLKGPPQKYCWVPMALVRAFPLEDVRCVFEAGGVEEVGGEEEEEEEEEEKEEAKPKAGKQKAISEFFSKEKGSNR